MLAFAKIQKKFLNSSGANCLVLEDLLPQLLSVPLIKAAEDLNYIYFFYCIRYIRQAVYVYLIRFVTLFDIYLMPD